MLEYNGESIRYMWQKLKSFLANDAYFYAFLILIIGVLSFGLGRLSVSENTGNGNQQAGFQALPPHPPDISSKKSANMPVVASKSGTKYHLLDCPGALQIKTENRIDFTSVEAAQAAGYTPAGNCPGLE